MAKLPKACLKSAPLKIIAAGLWGAVIGICASSASASEIAEALPPAAPPAQRVYDPEQLARGETLYQQYCSSCHGKQAVGTTNWRQRDSEGRYPPPPLNGSAHTWHHPLGQLRHLIRDGGPAGKSNMPGFKDVLTDQQIYDIIAWVQSLWTDDIYATWYTKDQRAREMFGDKLDEQPW